MAVVNQGFSSNIPSYWNMQIKPSHWKNCLYIWGLGEVNGISSQCGQAELILKINNGINGEKTFLDIGANDGMTRSSTYILECLGWSGVLVEPNPSLIPTIKCHRPNSILLNCALGQESSIETLVTSSSLSGLGTLSQKTNEKNIQRLVKECAENDYIIENHHVVQIEAHKVFEFTEKYLNSTISYLKIDAEGSEDVILNSIYTNIQPNRYPIFLEIENNYRDEVKTIASLNIIKHFVY